MQELSSYDWNNYFPLWLTVNCASAAIQLRSLLTILSECSNSRLYLPST